jgi:hypothetical protein
VGFIPASTLKVDIGATSNEVVVVPLMGCCNFV